MTSSVVVRGMIRVQVVTEKQPHVPSVCVAVTTQIDCATVFH
jgi:hypothetical protein